MLCADLLEGKGIDNKKEFVAEYGVVTATMLRLVAPYFGSACVVIADNWFGSYKCAVALRQRGLFSIINVKTRHKKFPRDKIKEALQRRGDQKHYRVQPPGEEWPDFASGYFDKGPMILVHTAGSSMLGLSCKRVHRRYDYDAKRVKSVVLELMQPDTHARYRGSFWAVDRFNRMAFGPEGVHRTVRVKGWHRRFFLALLSATVLNAYMAYNQVQ